MPCVRLFTTKSPTNESPTIDRMELVIEAAKTVMPATSATPTIRADAVRAVRFGLRMEFLLAKTPVVPTKLGRGEPITPATGRAINGPRTNSPMKSSGTPPASQDAPPGRRALLRP